MKALLTLMIAAAGFAASVAWAGETAAPRAPAVDIPAAATKADPARRAAPAAQPRPATSGGAQRRQPANTLPELPRTPSVICACAFDGVSDRHA